MVGLSWQCSTRIFSRGSIVSSWVATALSSRIRDRVPPILARARRRQPGPRLPGPANVLRAARAHPRLPPFIITGVRVTHGVGWRVIVGACGQMRLHHGRRHDTIAIIGWVMKNWVVDRLALCAGTPRLTLPADGDRTGAWSAFW